MRSDHLSKHIRTHTKQKNIVSNSVSLNWSAQIFSHSYYQWRQIYESKVDFKLRAPLNSLGQQSQPWHSFTLTWFTFYPVNARLRIIAKLFSPLSAIMHLVHQLVGFAMQYYLFCVLCFYSKFQSHLLFYFSFWSFDFYIFLSLLSLFILYFSAVFWPAILIVMVCVCARAVQWWTENGMFRWIDRKCETAKFDARDCRRQIATSILIGIANHLGTENTIATRCQPTGRHTCEHDNDTATTTIQPNQTNELFAGWFFFQFLFFIFCSSFSSTLFWIYVFRVIPPIVSRGFLPWKETSSNSYNS